MAATVSQVADGLKARLATISGLRTFSYQPEQLNPPIAFPSLSSIQYHRAFAGGNVQMVWIIRVIVGRYLDRTAHALLDEYLSYSGAKSIRAALEADTTLGGVAASLVVSSSADISSLAVDGAEFLEIQTTVTVHA